MQCLNVLVDILEEAKEKKRSLFGVSYDIEKAYDSIQLYSIIASLERFNLPSEFIFFVEQGLKNASSQFKTPYGLTKGFAIQSSVRQGDPLAPFLFILIADALHDGLANNPLFPSVSSGYRFGTDSSLRISSLGYADDTFIFGETWEQIWCSHSWVREFCRAHCLNINWKKTRFFGSDWEEGEERCLWPVQGEILDQKTGTFPLTVDQKITMQGPDVPFKYLGVYLTMNLDWGPQRGKMDSIIRACVRRMRSNKLQAHQKVVMARELIFTQMDPGLQMAEIPRQVLKKWNSLITHAIASHPQFPTAFSLNSQAINYLTGIPDMLLHYHARRTGETWIRLNSIRNISGRTARARWKALTTTAKGNFGSTRSNRLARILNNARSLLNVELVHEPRSNWDVSEERNLIAEKVNGKPVLAFTDGSTECKLTSPFPGRVFALWWNQRLSGPVVSKLILGGTIMLLSMPLLVWPLLSYHLISRLPYMRTIKLQYLNNKKGD